MSYATGLEGFREVVRAQMSITANSTGIAVTGTGDQNLDPPTGYVKIPMFIQPSEGYIQGTGIEISDSKIVVTRAINVIAFGHLNVSHSVNDSHVSAVFGIRRDGVLTLTDRPVTTKLAKSSDLSSLSGQGLVPFEMQPGDELELHIASDFTGTVTPRAGSITVLGSVFA